MLKAAHLRHPLRTARLATARLHRRLKMGRFAALADRCFAGDPRYNLQSVAAGFAFHFEPASSHDDELLDRICTAYIAAVHQQDAAPAVWQPTAWWTRIREASLQPVTHALLTRDLAALHRMYSNFSRDPCSSGLIGLPCGIPKPSTGSALKDLHRRVYLADTLYRLDYWALRTGGRFAHADLAGPGIGNPYGAQMEHTLIEDGAEYRHCCAQTILGVLDNTGAAVAEIGGGFGGMAYYLLRDRPGTKYINFDVPESLALAAYFLMKALPRLNFRLCGEAHAPADIALLPLPELAKLPQHTVDAFFSSRAMSDVSPSAMEVYLNEIVRVHPAHFLYIGSERSGRVIADLAGSTHRRLQLVAARASEWHKQTNPEASEVECLYRIS